METNNFDINKMSRETGIPILAIQRNLGMPIDYVCRANTLEEAKKSYNDLSKNQVEEKAIVIKRWDEIFLLEIEKADTLKKFAEIDLLSPPETTHKQTLFEKRDECVISEMKKVSTLREIKIIYEGKPPYSKYEPIILKRWKEAFLSQVNKAKRTEEIEEIYWLKPEKDDENLLKLVWKRWIKLSKTPKDILPIYLSIFEYYDSGHEIIRIDPEIKNLLLMKKISVSTTIKDLKGFMNKVFDFDTGNSIRDSFCRRWISFSNSKKEILDLRKLIPLKGKAERLAVKKLASFYGWKE